MNILREASHGQQFRGTKRYLIADFWMQHLALIADNYMAQLRVSVLVWMRTAVQGIPKKLPACCQIRPNGKNIWAPWQVWSLHFENLKHVCTESISATFQCSICMSDWIHMYAHILNQYSCQHRLHNGSLHNNIAIIFSRSVRPRLTLSLNLESSADQSKQGGIKHDSPVAVQGHVHRHQPLQQKSKYRLTRIHQI